MNNRTAVLNPPSISHLCQRLQCMADGLRPPDSPEMQLTLDQLAASRGEEAAEQNKIARLDEVLADFLDSVRQTIQGERFLDGGRFKAILEEKEQEARATVAEEPWASELDFVSTISDVGQLFSQVARNQAQAKSPG